MFGKELMTMAKKQIRCASLTVEAAWIVPISWLCVVLLIAVNFYVHNTVWYQAAAYEAALTGNGREGELQGRTAAQLAEEKLEARLEDRIMPGNRPEMEVAGESSGTEIWLRGQVFPGISDKVLNYQVSARVEKIRPVAFMRQERIL